MLSALKRSVFWARLPSEACQDAVDGFHHQYVKARQNDECSLLSFATWIPVCLCFLKDEPCETSPSLCYDEFAIAVVLVVVVWFHRQRSTSCHALSAVFPPGAQIGTSVDITVTSGVELEEISKLFFNHPGIVATPKMQDVAGKPTPIPNQFIVAVAADVPPGHYEVRTIGFFGISNPRFFIVGNQKELNETEPNNAREQANVLEFNQTVNGRVNGGADVDWFRFAAKRDSGCWSTVWQGGWIRNSMRRLNCTTCRENGWNLPDEILSARMR